MSAFRKKVETRNGVVPKAFFLLMGLNICIDCDYEIDSTRGKDTKNL